MLTDHELAQLVENILIAFAAVVNLLGAVLHFALRRKVNRAARKKARPPLPKE